MCKAKLDLSKLNKTEPWSIEDLKQAIKDLDNNKSRDAIGHAHEILKCAGSDLTLAVLKFMNRSSCEFSDKWQRRPDTSASARC